MQIALIQLGRLRASFAFLVKSLSDVSNVWLRCIRYAINNNVGGIRFTLIKYYFKEST